ncbi:radical SAM family heme chaperone HemW [Pseudomonadota bacterium]
MVENLPPLALYAHFPWCVQKCPYCDFNSHKLETDLPEDQYIDALLVDLKQDLAHINDRHIETIFLGGGTPSLFSPRAIERLLSEIREMVSVRQQAEITLEANPGTISREQLEGYLEAGVNRLSIGVQSFEQEKLSKLRRIHDRSEALNAAIEAKAAGFDNFNLDMMFGLPGQDVSQARDDLLTAISLQPSHLSIYQLTVEPNTYFHRYPPPLPNEDTIWEMHQQLQKQTIQSGYTQYEVSAFALENARCKHNINYWEFGDYLGIGAGAHGKISTKNAITRFWKTKHPKTYLAKSLSSEVIGGCRELQKSEMAIEFMMNALRLPQGFALSLFTQRTGQPFSTIEEPMKEAQNRNWIELTKKRCRPSERGFRFLNNLVELFLPSQ